MRIAPRWKVLALLDPSSSQASSLIDRNILFNIEPNPGFFGQFSLPRDNSYVPLLLKPTVVYHQAIGRQLRTRYRSLDSRRFPYRLDLEDTGPTDLTIKIRLFPPCILSLTVQLSCFEMPSSRWSADKLIEIQTLSRYKLVADIVRWTIGIASSLSHQEFDRDPSYVTFPGLHIAELCEPEELFSHFQANAAFYAGVLIRNRHWSRMAERITKDVLTKNQELNVKSTAEMMLLDKQGMLFLSANDPESHGEYAKRFSRAFDICEIGLAYRLFLQHYPYVRSSNEDFFDFVFSKIRLSIEQAKAYFSHSVSNRDLWMLVGKELALAEYLRMIARNQALSDAVDRKQPYFDRLSRGWWSNPRFSLLLSTEIARSDDLDLTPIQDQAHRRRILEDFQEASRSLQANNFKAAIILSGAIVEAMLLAILEENPPPGIAVARLRREGLSNYLEYAWNVGRISDLTVRRLLDETLREWRNMIHPGKMIRSDFSVDRSRAEVALASVRMLSKELSKTTPSV